jgi:hypothetical protein
LAQTLDNLAGHVKALATGANRIEARMTRLIATMEPGQERDFSIAEALMALGSEEENEYPAHVRMAVEGSARMMQLRMRPENWPPTEIGPT